MLWYALPSFLAILLKLCLTWHFWERLQQNGILLGLFVGFLVLNALEFTSFFLSVDAIEGLGWMMHAYYVAGTFTAAAILAFCMSVTGRFPGSYYNALAVVACVIALASAIPGLILDGWSFHQARITMRVPGPALFVWNGFVLLCMATSIVLLYRAYRQAKELAVRRASLLMLLGTLPSLLTAGAVIGFSQLGYALNATVYLSSATIIFMLTLAVSSTRYSVFQLLSLVPGTEERRIASRVNRLTTYLKKCVFAEADNSALFRNARSEMEASLVELAIWAHGDNKSAAAKQLGISRATLSRKEAQPTT